MNKLTERDRERITQTVAAAERGTSGEIRCVLAEQTADPHLPALLAGAGVALFLLPAIVLGWMQISRMGGWDAGGMTSGQQEFSLGLYAAAQAALFLVIWRFGVWHGLWRALTPADLLSARVHAAALAQFEALGLTATRDRTGILLYVSLADRRAEVLADIGIYAKAEPKVWDEVVALLVAGLKAGDPAAGFVSAVERTGEILAACLPPREDDVNELPDGLIETRR
ncbi:MAG: hypothetical protein JWM33_3780 [Caulobacteraceae bacterium]|nr:hypothetical protein [Caulobacteraceae bacterium]